MNEATISRHPFEPFIPQNATKLIVGTIPPYRFCTSPQNLCDKDVNFYYGSKDNYFWETLAEITGVHLEYNNSETAVNQRKTLLQSLNTGVTDIIDQCIHKDGKSDDSSLECIKCKPIAQLLEQNQKIDTLLYTSKKLIVHLVNCQADKGYHENWDSSRNGTVYINQKKYNVILLYSPSPSGRRRISREKMLSQYKAIFGEVK